MSELDVPQSGATPVDVAFQSLIAEVVDVLAESRRGVGGIDAARFADDGKLLVLRARQLAADFRHRQVDVDHLLVALFTSDPANLLTGGDESRLVSAASADMASADAGAAGQASELAVPLAGTLVRLASLASATGGRPGPSVDFARWIAEVAGFAAAGERRAGARDFHAALFVGGDAGDRRLREKVRRLMNEAWRVGRPQSELVRARRSLQNFQQTTGYFRAETRQGFGDLRETIGALDSRLTSLAEVSRASGERLATIAGRVEAAPVVSADMLRAAGGDATPKLAKVEAEVESLGRALAERRDEDRAGRREMLAAIAALRADNGIVAAYPMHGLRPPRPFRLALAVLAVLTAGGAIGWSLTPDGRAALQHKIGADR